MSRLSVVPWQGSSLHENWRKFAPHIADSMPFHYTKLVFPIEIIKFCRLLMSKRLEEVIQICEDSPFKKKSENVVG